MALIWEKVSARLQPATAGHDRLVLGKTVPFFCTTLYILTYRPGSRFCITSAKILTGLRLGPAFSASSRDATLKPWPLSEWIIISFDKSSYDSCLKKTLLRVFFRQESLMPLLLLASMPKTSTETMAPLLTVWCSRAWRLVAPDAWVAIQWDL